MCRWSNLIIGSNLLSFLLAGRAVSSLRFSKALICHLVAQPFNPFEKHNWFGMAAAMHLCGVKTPNHSFSRNLSCQPLWPRQRLNFVSSVGSVTGFCRPLEGSSCKGRVLQVSCERGNTDVAKSQCYEGVANEFTCAMKFGGSSVASADRMREVADLILSFPEERPVIVLSAMGKTTNKLLLVLYLSFFYINHLFIS